MARNDIVIDLPKTVMDHGFEYESPIDAKLTVPDPTWNQTGGALVFMRHDNHIYLYPEQAKALKDFLNSREDI